MMMSRRPQVKTGRPVTPGGRIGELLVQLREKQKLSQEQLAARVGCHRHTIRALERGATIPTPARIDRLVEVLDIGPAEHARLIDGAVRMKMDRKYTRWDKQQVTTQTNDRSTQ